MSAAGMEGGSSATIIVVDDDFMNLKIAERLLRNEYEVILAKSGSELFQHLKKITPDLILLDVFMPEMDGHEVIKKLKSVDSYSEIPVIFMTAQDGDSELQGISEGALDYVTKPFRKQLLLQRVKHLLELEKLKKGLQYSSVGSTAASRAAQPSDSASMWIDYSGEDLTSDIITEKLLNQADAAKPGAIELEYPMFAKMFEFITNIEKRYHQTFHMAMITMDITVSVDEFEWMKEQAIHAMREAIKSSIRSVDLCTRCSDIQYLVVLMNVGEENIPLVINRIFKRFYAEISEDQVQVSYSTTRIQSGLEEFE